MSERGAATSADVYWLTYKIVDVMEVLLKCRPGSSPFHSFVKWNAVIDNHELYRYMIPATDIKYKYDVAKRDIRVNQELIRGDPPIVKVQIHNDAVRSFDQVVVRCLVSRAGTESEKSRDLASKRHTIENLEKDGSLEFKISYPDLIGQKLDGVQVDCMIFSATLEDPAVTTLE